MSLSATLFFGVDLFPRDKLRSDDVEAKLDTVEVLRFENGLVTAGGEETRISLECTERLEFPLLGIDGLSIVFGGTGREALTLTYNEDEAGSLVSLLGSFSFEVASELLRPAVLQGGVWVADPASDAVSLTVSAGLSIDERWDVQFDPGESFSVPAFFIADTGIVVQSENVSLHLSDTATPPPGTSGGFRGVYIEAGVLSLPQGLLDVLPDGITLQQASVGNGGFSGTVTGSWSPQWSGNSVSGAGAGTLGGMAFGLESLSLTFAQNAITASHLAGVLRLPFFDQPLGVALSLAMDGSFHAALSQPDAQGLVTLTIPHLGTLTVASLAFVSDADGASVVLSGTLQLDVLSPPLEWPAIEIQELRITTAGEIILSDGWLVLQVPAALDLFGFRFEISRIGFGNEDDGRRWVGFSGGVQLVEFLPTGASVEGLRMIWDPMGGPIEVTLQGVGVELTLPGLIHFAGDVALINEETERYFTGNARLELLPLGINLDAAVKIGHDLDEGYKYVYTFMGLTLPIGIPLWATGAAIYGISGLYGMNVKPSAQNGDWYGWYAGAPEEFNVTNAGKWVGEEDGKALGAGMVLGTMFDLGRVVSAKALFALVLPGPVIMLHGMANMLQLPPDPEDPQSEGVFNALAVLDARAGNLQLNIDAGWGKPPIIDIAASAEAYFDFANPRNWHLYLGQDQPEDRRIRAEYLALFHADAYLMIDSTGIATGASISYGADWRFGPVTAILRAWLAAGAAITWQPPQLEGNLALGGEFEVAVAGFGVGIGAEATLSGKAPTLYWVRGELALQVKLPFPLKDLEEQIALEWKQEATPLSEDPFRSIGLEHLKVAETWTDLPDAYQDATPGSAGYQPGPIVPLDARPSIAFDRAMKDVTSGIEISSVAPYPGGTNIGGHIFDYELQEVVLEKWAKAGGSGWQVVEDLGCWMAIEGGDGEPAASTFQIWTSSPFAFTRQSARVYRDAFLLNHAIWPCAEAPQVTTHCVDWEMVRPGTKYGPCFEYATLAFTILPSISVAVVESAITACGTRNGLRLQDGNEVLWIVFPEPVRALEICINGVYVAVRTLPIRLLANSVGLRRAQLLPDDRIQLRLGAHGACLGTCLRNALQR